jgi:Mat/Ecp fimbriae major subunit
MKNILKFSAVSAVVALGFGASAANAATANANASAVILTPVTVTKTADLDFGTIAIGSGGGNVAVAASDNRSCDTGLVCSGTTTSAKFSVSGVTGQVVGVSVPASMSLTSGANTMTATLSGTPASLTLAAGANAVAVGGSLAVAGNQAAGSYSGSFTVTVNYQ